MRTLALDLGSRRIGVAVSDPSGVLASPYLVLGRAGGHAADHQAIAGVVEETGASQVVVGLPLSLDGRHGPAAHLVLDEVDELRRALPVSVELHDERLTTVSAHRSLQATGMKGKARRLAVDKVAAAVLLQSWLDRPTQPEGET
ncbi:MAG: Holliday junction resolvase RuvX [Acidimicrobiales bacterium]